MFLENPVRIQSLWSRQWISRSMCVYIHIYVCLCVYMHNVHSKLGVLYTEVQHLRFWMLESKCGRKLQYLCLKLWYNSNLTLMGSAPLWMLWMHSGCISMRCWFPLDFRPYITGLQFWHWFAFAAKFISVSASVHGLQSAPAFFMVHWLLFYHCMLLVCSLLLLAFL